ncbi:CAP domain-containing protein [Natronorubrum sp. FCH18a]|uniref:CAP domain-containing protein n=1 Tax=Natronorubrum sp. FCH18a TaxID=3447018 RepID=UPI003F51206D
MGAAAPVSSAPDETVADSDDVSQANTAEHSDETTVTSPTSVINSSSTSGDTVDVSADAGNWNGLESVFSGLDAGAASLVESVLTGYGIADTVDDAADIDEDESDEGDDTDETDDADDTTDEDETDDEDTTDEDEADEDETDEADEDETDGTEEDETDDADDEDSTDEDETDDPADDDADDVDRAAVEQYVHEAVNEERAARGLEELEFDTELRDIARAHSEDMAERGYFSHVDPEGNDFSDRYDDAGYECNANGYTGGENIAQTWYDTPVSTDDGTVQYEDEQELGYGIVDQWMNSPDHRDNILAEQWENEGIGVHITDDDQVYVTQNFC